MNFTLSLKVQPEPPKRKPIDQYIHLIDLTGEKSKRDLILEGIKKAKELSDTRKIVGIPRLRKGVIWTESN